MLTHVRFAADSTGEVFRVLAVHGEWLWIEHRGHMPITAHESWVVGVAG